MEVSKLRSGSVYLVGIVVDYKDLGGGCITLVGSISRGHFRANSSTQNRRLPRLALAAGHALSCKYVCEPG